MIQIIDYSCVSNNCPLKKVNFSSPFKSFLSVVFMAGQQDKLSHIGRHWCHINISFSFPCKATVNKKQIDVAGKIKLKK